MGGVRSYWTAEAGEFTATKPKLRQIELSLKKLIGLCYLTDELLADSKALESIVKQAFVEEIGFMVEEGIVNGTGAGQPLGITNSNATVTVAAEGSQAAGSVVYDNICKMWGRLYAGGQKNAVWVVNQDVLPTLYGMTLNLSGYSPVYLPAGGAAGAPNNTIFGRPVIVSESCATAGALNDIILFDPTQYVIIDKGGVKTDTSIHVRFNYAESVIRFVYRADGQPMWHKAITPYKGTNTVSPYINLAARS